MTTYTPADKTIKALIQQIHKRGLTQFYEPDARAAIAIIARELGEEAARIAFNAYMPSDGLFVRRGCSNSAAAIRAHFGVTSAKSGSGG